MGNGQKIEFGLHIGEMVHDAIRRERIKLTDVAKHFNISVGSLNDRMRRTHYGDTYDLMEAQKLLKTDFLGYCRNAIDGSNIVYTQSEVDELKKKISELEAITKSQQKHIQNLQELLDLRKKEYEKNLSK